MHLLISLLLLISKSVDQRLQFYVYFFMYMMIMDISLCSGCVHIVCLD